MMDVPIDPAMLEWLRVLLQKAELELREFHLVSNYPECGEYTAARHFLDDLHAAHEAIRQMLTVAR